MDKKLLLEVYNFPEIATEIVFATKYMRGEVSMEEGVRHDFAKVVSEWIESEGADDLFYNTIMSHMGDKLGMYLELKALEEEALESFYSRKFRDAGLDRNRGSVN